LDFYPIKISIFLLLKNGLQFLGYNDPILVFYGTFFAYCFSNFKYYNFFIAFFSIA